jgi:hypothetical protein
MSERIFRNGPRNLRTANDIAELKISTTNSSPTTTTKIVFSCPSKEYGKKREAKAADPTTAIIGILKTNRIEQMEITGEANSNAIRRIDLLN